MTHSLRLVLAVASVLATAGCAGTPASAIPTTGPSSTAPSMVAATTPSATRSAPTRTPAPSAPAMNEPPAATMAAEGGDSVAGSLGSFTWGDGGSDSPWLPGAPIAVGAGESLTVVLAGEARARDWVAKRVAAGTVDGGGAVSLGHGDGEPIAFAPPAPGAWSVQVDVTFGDDLGAATYYWAVTVR